MKAIFFLCLAGIICSVHGAGKWGKNEISYSVDRRLDARKIGNALDGLEAVTCLKFKKVSGRADISIEYTTRQACYGPLGATSNHKIMMNKWCASNTGVIQKEMIIALGYRQRTSGLDKANIAMINKDYC